MKTLKKIILFLFLFSPLILAVGPNIVPDPFYQFEVNGTIERANGQSLKDFTVTLMGKNKNIKEFTLMYLNQSEIVATPDQPIFITDSSGKFQIRTSSKVGAIDSLALCIISNDKGRIRFNSFSPLEVTADEVKTSVSYSNESGCSCQNSTSSESVIIGYTYKFNNKVIQIPF